MAQTLPDRDFAVNASEIGYATVLIAEGKTDEAEKKLRATISILQTKHDIGLTELLGLARRFRGLALLDSGRTQDGEKELLCAVEIFTSLGTEASLQKIHCLLDLCELYLVQNRTKDAKALIAEAMAILDKSCGPDEREFIRADLINECLLSLTDDDKQNVVENGLQRLQYAFGAKNPNVKRAIHDYLAVLKKAGAAQRLHLAENKFDDSLTSAG